MKSNERNRFESSQATRLNRAVGLIFRLASVEATSLLAGTEPPVITEIIVVALLERAQRQNGLCPCQAPALAFALHPVLHHGTAGRLHDAGPDRQARGQVRVVLHPTPMVVEERDDFRERLPDRLPELLLRQDLSQAADDIAHPAAENLRQLLLHPVLARLGAFPDTRR